MKRTFSPRHNLADRLLKLSWGGGLVVIVGALTLLRVLFPDTTWRLVSPIANLGASASRETYLWSQSFADTRSLVLERDALLESQRSLQNEVAHLRAQMEDVAALPGDSVAAGVIARPPMSPYDTLVISRGSTTGLQKGMLVIAPGNAPVGTVEAVSASSARVRLFTSSGVTTHGWIAEGVALTIVGNGGGSYVAEIARTAGVAVGDRVYAPGPGRLPLGVVSRIDEDPSSAAVTLRILPSANLFSLSWVEVREGLQPEFETASTTAPL